MQSTFFAFAGRGPWRVLMLGMLIGASGCADVVVVSTQEVGVTVTDIETGEPVADAVVEVAVSSDQIPPLDQFEADEVFELSASQSATTDAEGQAQLKITTSRLASLLPLPGWRDPGLDPSLDVLTGTRCFFRIASAGQRETFYVTMEPATRSDGTRFAVTVDSIGEGQAPSQAEHKGDESN